MLFGGGALGWIAGRLGLAAYAVMLLGIIVIMDLWDSPLLSLYLSGTAVLIREILGGLIGLMSALSAAIWRVVRPVCDFLQTIPMFVFLIPVLMFFQIGEFSALLAIYSGAVVPMIRYTRRELASTPEEQSRPRFPRARTSGRC